MILALRLRNAPTQARSRRRLRRVLAAADELLVRDGAEGFATTRIAQLAEVPVGSVYHFFADKEAIAEALAISYWSDLEQRVAAIADAAEAGDVPEDPAVAVFDALADGLRAQPGFLALWYGDLRTLAVREATRPARRRFTASLRRIIDARWGDAPERIRDEVAETVVIAGDGLLREAFRLHRAGDAEVLAEARAMLSAYTHARLDRESLPQRSPAC